MSARPSNMTFAGQSLHWLVEMMGGTLENLPINAISMIDIDGELYWSASSNASGEVVVLLRLDHSSQEMQGAELSLVLLSSTSEALLLRWRGSGNCGALIRPLEAVPASAMDRMACNWLARRFKNGHRFRPAPNPTLRVMEESLMAPS